MKKVKKTLNTDCVVVIHQRRLTPCLFVFLHFRFERLLLKLTYNKRTTKLVKSADNKLEGCRRH